MGIKLKDISLEIKGKQILKDVNLEINDGEFVSLLGASGAGKSTIIKVVSGILGQTEGNVIIDGSNVDRLPTHKRGTSIVFQDIRLFPNMSIGENVAYALKLQGVPKAERIKKADYYLGLVHLSGFGERRVHELSGGQQQRVALARSVAGNPKALLLDEPFSGLDEELRDDMRQTVRSIHDELGLTTLMITHDADEALMMSDRIAYLNAGQIVQFCKPAELYSQPASPEAAACFGNCLNIEGTVSKGVFNTRGFSAKTTCQDGPAVAILRRDGITAVAASEGAPVLDCSFRGKQHYVGIEINDKEMSFYSEEPIEVGAEVALNCTEECTFIFARQ